MENETNNTPYEISKLMESGISINQLPRLLEQMYKAHQNLFIWGFMGLGKTQMITQFVAKQREKDPEFGMIYRALASENPEDITGLPMPYKDENGLTRTAYAIPKNLPTDKNSRGVFVVDEFNNGQGSTQNSYQQLIQERKVGDYELPDGWWVVAMGNQSGVNAYSNEIQAPVKDRFGHIFVSSNADAWTDYIMGLENVETDNTPFLPDITPEKIKILTCAFIKRNPDKLFDEQEYNRNSYTFATPRSWERFIKLYSANLNATKNDVKIFASMYVGAELANMLVEYFENSKKYQDPYEILVDGKGFKDTQDLNGFMGTLMGCIAVLNQKPNAEQVKNLLNAGFKLPRNDWQTILGKMVISKSQIKPYIDKKQLTDLAVLISKSNSNADL